ncbi:MAG: signal peptidase I [bacterium]
MTIALLLLICTVLFIIGATILYLLSRYKKFHVKDFTFGHAIILMSAIVVVGAGLSFISMFWAAIGVFPVFLYFLTKQHNVGWKEALSMYAINVIIFLTFMSVLVQPFFMYVSQPFLIKDNSMTPALHNNELIFINRLAAFFKRGDIVVWRYREGSDEYYVHRVVGIPFDTVEIKDGKVFINNEEYQEPYVSSSPEETVLVSLKDDGYFLMSDDRVRGWDSRHFGPVQKGDIVGRILFKK